MPMLKSTDMVTRAVRWCKEDPYAACSMLPTFWRELEFVRHAAQLRKRTSLHLSHQAAAMHLHGPFSETDIAGDLFAKAALRDMNHDLALARAQRFKTFPECSQCLFTCPPGTIASEADLDGIKKVLIAERLRQKLNGTTFHSSHRHGNVAMPCDEDDWEVPVGRGEVTLKLETASPRQSHVEHQAGGTIRLIGFEKVGNRRE